jgi:hypothetical protein
MPRRLSEKSLVIVTRVGTVAATTAFAFLIACGSEPKKEPTASTATASVSATPPPLPAASDAKPNVASAPDAGGGKSDKQTECAALVDDANSSLDAERIAVDKVCKKDVDCMPIKGRACGFNCVTGAIPKVEEKEWNETLTKVKDGPCKKWDANECAKLRTKPPPTCQDRKVWCDKGHCALKEGK